MEVRLQPLTLTLMRFLEPVDEHSIAVHLSGVLGATASVGEDGFVRVARTTAGGEDYIEIIAIWRPKLQGVSIGPWFVLVREEYVRQFREAFQVLEKPVQKARSARKSEPVAKTRPGIVSMYRTFSATPAYPMPRIG